VFFMKSIKGLLEPSFYINHREALEKFPMLKKKGLKGMYEWCKNGGLQRRCCESFLPHTHTHTHTRECVMTSVYVRCFCVRVCVCACVCVCVLVSVC